MFRLPRRIFCLLSAGIMLTGIQPGFFVTAKEQPSNKIPTKSITMTVGEEQSLPGVSQRPPLSCISSQINTVSVSQQGILTAHNTGTATILYNLLGKGVYRIAITVTDDAQNSGSKDSAASQIPLELSDQVLFMEPDDSYSLTLNGDLSTTEKAGLQWESSDNHVAKVDAMGKITAKGKGSAVITCSNGSNSASVSVNVVTRDYDGNACDFSILTADGSTRVYRLYKQNAHNYPKYDNYLAWHGCATCSLTSVLGAYNTDYADILPSEVIDGPEKNTVSAEAWKREHKERSLPKQMPLSLYGITSILEKHDVTVDYVRTYEETEAANDIISHLKTGNPVIFEVRQKSNKTGKKSSRWTNSYHTMVLLGVLTNGKVLVYDPVDKNWKNNGNRITITDLSDVMEFMFPCTEFDKAMYYNGASSDGGYIKVFDTEE